MQPQFLLNLFLIKLRDPMDRLQLSDILVPGAKLEPIILDGLQVTDLIDKTKQKQAEIIKLKEVDETQLRMVVQL